MAATCPACGGQLQIDPQYAGWQVRCPHCGTEFTAAPAAAPPPAPYPGGQPWPSRPMPPGELIEAAARAVHGPAVALQIAAWAHLLLAVAIGGGLVLLGLSARKADGVVFVALGVAIGAFGVPYFAAVAYGAVRMKRLDGRGWAMAAAIMAVAAFQVVGVCAIVVMGIGIWALAALSKDYVKAAFEDARRGGGGGGF